MKVKDIIRSLYPETVFEIYDINSDKSIIIASSDDGIPVPKKYLDCEIYGITNKGNVLFITIDLPED